MTPSPPAQAETSETVEQIAERNFVNELGNKISIFVRSGKPGRNVLSRTEMRGPNSTAQNNMTRMELEQLRDAINEALPSAAIQSERDSRDSAWTAGFEAAQDAAADLLDQRGSYADESMAAQIRALTPGEKS